MIAQQHTIPDAEIISMIGQTNSLAWEYLYDKYAPIMYGAILRITDDVAMAQEILMESFVQMKTNTTLLQNKKPLYLSLLHHTCATSIKILTAKGVEPKKNDALNESFPMMNCLLFNPHSLKGAAEMHALPEEEIKRRLLLEIIEIRKKYAQKANPPE